MRVAIAGGHGAIALHLTRMLVARGDAVRSLVRRKEHCDELRALGAEPVLCDLEALDADEVAARVGSADALVFAAGAGPGSGAARKATMDRDGAVKTIEACRANAIGRYAMISAMGAADPPDGDDVFSVYLRAKASADAAVVASGLAYAIVRPGRLTDEPGTGRVRAGARVPRGEIPREDVAAVLVACLGDPRATGLTFELVSGDDPIPAAIATLAQPMAEGASKTSSPNGLRPG
jgi:uncharacterized protein YbjT (DUF2867 family)